MPYSISYGARKPASPFDSSPPATRRFGHDWYVERRSAILLVPPVVTRMERNLIINADHPEFPRLQAGPETPVRWDERLFT